MSDFKLAKRVESLKIVEQGMPQALAICKQLHAAIERLQNAWQAYELSEPDAESRIITGLDFQSQAQVIMNDAAIELAYAVDGVAEVLGVTRGDILSLIESVPEKAED